MLFGWRVDFGDGVAPIGSSTIGPSRAGATVPYRIEGKALRGGTTQAVPPLLNVSASEG